MLDAMDMDEIKSNLQDLSRLVRSGDSNDIERERLVTAATLTFFFFLVSDPEQTCRVMKQIIGYHKSAGGENGKGLESLFNENKEQQQRSAEHTTSTTGSRVRGDSAHPHSFSLYGEPEPGQRAFVFFDFVRSPMVQM